MSDARESTHPTAPAETRCSHCGKVLDGSIQRCSHGGWCLPIPLAAPQATAEPAQIAKQEKQRECKQPPSDWRCTRGEGHDGPCAAVPTLPKDLEDKPEFHEMYWKLRVKDLSMKLAAAQKVQTDGPLKQIIDLVQPKLSELIPYAGQLCEDEGCPHYGTPDVCNPEPAPAPQAPAESQKEEELCGGHCGRCDETHADWGRRELALQVENASLRGQLELHNKAEGEAHERSREYLDKYDSLSRYIIPLRIQLEEMTDEVKELRAQLEQRDKDVAQMRVDVLTAIEGERLTEEPTEADDIAYNHAIDHAKEAARIALLAVQTAREERAMSEAAKNPVPCPICNQIFSSEEEFEYHEAICMPPTPEESNTIFASL